MSNQVYSNNIVSSWQNMNKYQAMRGNNLYQQDGEISVGDETIPITFPIPVMIFDNGQLITSNINGVTIKVEGMYSINATLPVTVFVAGTPTFLTMNCEMHDVTNNITLALDQQVIPPLTASTTNLTYFQVNYTGYFKVGHQISFLVTNRGPLGYGLSVGPSNLIITKIE